MTKRDRGHDIAHADQLGHQSTFIHQVAQSHGNEAIVLFEQIAEDRHPSIISIGEHERVPTRFLPLIVDRHAGIPVGFFTVHWGTGSDLPDDVRESPFVDPSWHAFHVLVDQADLVPCRFQAKEFQPLFTGPGANIFIQGEGGVFGGSVQTYLLLVVPVQEDMHLRRGHFLKIGGAGGKKTGEKCQVVFAGVFLPPGDLLPFIDDILGHFTRQIEIFLDV